MEKTAHLAGFVAAHGIWSVSDGDTLVVMVGSIDAHGRPTIERILTELADEGVRIGRKQLAENSRKVACAALAFDGYVTLREGRTDAVIVEARDYTSTIPAEFNIAIPYRHADKGFAVHRPKLITLPPGDPNTALEAFWAGVDSHTAAAAVWSAHIDESR